MAYHQEWNIFYKEFLPRSPAQGLKAFIKGSRGTLARLNSEALLRAGFNAPLAIAWGRLSGSREYLFSQAVPGTGVGQWLKGGSSNPEWANLAERRKFLRELGVFIGRLHTTGFIHGDLQTRNILAYPGPHRFEFSLIGNEGNSFDKPVPGKLLLKNLMQLNMHGPKELSRSDRLRFFRAWHSQMRDLSRLEAGVLAVQSYRWAMKRLG